MNFPIQSYYRIVGSNQLVTGILLTLVLLLGAVLRFYALGASGYWYDEVIMVHVAQQDLSVLAEGFPAVRPPLYVILAHFWIQLFGISEFATRSLSAILGVASLALLYVFGRELFDRRVALASTFLMAISEFQIWYSQDFRYYPLMVFMTLLSFLFYVRALKTDRRMDWSLYVVASILLFYTHYLGILILVAQGLYFTIRWIRQKGNPSHWLISQSVILMGVGVSILSFLPSTVAGRVEPMKETVMPSIWTPFITAVKFVVSGRYDLPQTTIVLIVAGGITYLVITVLLFVLNIGPKRWLAAVGELKNRVGAYIAQESDTLGLLFCWFLCPLVLLFLISIIFGPIYRHKYVIGAAPALYLLLAFGMSLVRRVLPEVATLGLIAILAVPGLQRYYVTEPQEQWREVAAYVQAHSSHNDVVIFPIFQHLEQPHGLEMPSLHLTFYWYYKGDLPTCDANLQRAEQGVQVFEILSRCMENYESAWVIVYDTPAGFQDLLRQPDLLLDSTRSLTLLDAADFTDIALYQVKLEGKSTGQVGW